ncbi:MAG: asparagine synthase (glutamine-hydrolyzing) [Gammaproteobacteria bacterium]|nr:asparagine synthase (glutamine-hydrolyzing) [Gammaproteobacteria bacterium]
MCGIAGVFNVPGIESHHVREMVNLIHHRGPDEQGVEKFGPVILGHARLAVVDPENGLQPMSNEDGTVWVSFNGEIYNYVELREELKTRGHRFKSRCDTEVLVHLWEEEGEAMLARLIGMFAFFIWDTNTNRGMLVRDRQGIKPCFIADYKGGFAFASEIKAILSLPDMERKINDEALKEVLCFNYAMPDHTCFAGIVPLEPGHYLSLDGNGSISKHCYWDWPVFEDKKAVQFEELETLLDDAVRLQMRFDVKGGMYLSGGVDSSVVASHLKPQWIDHPLEAVGLNFIEPEYSEFKYSQQAASHLGIDLLEAKISHEMIPEIADKVSYHAEQPHGDFSFFLNYILARGANRNNKIVMFTGDGPDESMCGFTHNEAHFKKLGNDEFSAQAYFDLICYMDRDLRGRVLDPEFNRSTRDPADRFAEILAPWSKLDATEQVQAYETKYLMLGNNMVKGDRMGACWSTEGRAPFLDHRVSEMLTRLPAEQKIQKGVGKFFLKNYAAERYPQELIFKKKGMPTTPIGEWIKGPLYDWARSILAANEDSRFNTAAMLELLDEHRDGVANHTRALRTLIMTQVWLKLYFQ